jgi:hypothetical protein
LPFAALAFAYRLRLLPQGRCGVNLTYLPTENPPVEYLNKADELEREANFQNYSQIITFCIIGAIFIIFTQSIYFVSSFTFSIMMGISFLTWLGSLITKARRAKLKEMAELRTALDTYTLPVTFEHTRVVFTLPAKWGCPNLSDRLNHDLAITVPQAKAPAELRQLLEARFIQTCNDFSLPYFRFDIVADSPSKKLTHDIKIGIINGHEPPLTFG